MGDIADSMLDGTLCACCGDFLGVDAGHPVIGACCGGDAVGDASEEIFPLATRAIREAKKEATKAQRARKRRHRRRRRARRLAAERILRLAEVGVYWRSNHGPVPAAKAIAAIEAVLRDPHLAHSVPAIQASPAPTDEEIPW